MKVASYRNVGRLFYWLPLEAYDTQWVKQAKSVVVSGRISGEIYIAIQAYWVVLYWCVIIFVIYEEIVVRLSLKWFEFCDKYQLLFYDRWINQ